jgi:hypothetical protein
MSNAPVQNLEEKPALKTPQELVHIKHKITLLQYKYWVLMVRAFREAYERGERFESDKEYCYLSTSQLQDYLGYAPKTADIEHDLEAIRREPIIFNVLEKNGEKAKSGRGFISEWKVTSNRIGVIFPSVIREAIENLGDKGSLFHLLNWQAFNSFTGKYEAILYKLCKDFVGVGGPKPMSVEEFRAYMGIKDSEYPDFKRLNQWVISGPIKRINTSELSDIEIAARFEREKRKVVSIKFLVKSKRQTMMDFGENAAFRFARESIEHALQKQYLALRSPDEIELCIDRANEYGEKEEKTGKSVNYGGLYRKAITEGWHTQHAEKKARKKSVAVEMQKKAEEKQQEKTAKEEALREATAKNIAELDKFDAMPEDIKRRIREEYLKSVELPALRRAFEKEGERHPIHRSVFVQFLYKNVNT